MSEFERIVKFHPAFDKRHSDPKRNYGIHGVELLMALKGAEGTTQFLLYTNWHLPSALGIEIKDDMTSHHWRRAYESLPYHAPMPADLGYHSPKPTYEGHEPIGSECEFVDGPCYYDGSTLNAWRPFEALLREGDEGVWRVLEDYYESVFSWERMFPSEAL